MKQTPFYVVEKVITNGTKAHCVLSSTLITRMVKYMPSELFESTSFLMKLGMRKKVNQEWGKNKIKEWGKNKRIVNEKKWIGNGKSK